VVPEAELFWMRLPKGSDLKITRRVAQLSVFLLPVPELWVPRPCVLCKGGYDAAATIGFAMPSGLHRTYGAHHLHFITQHH
jgi:hypothetical protein